MTEDGFRKRFRNCRLVVGETFARFTTCLARYFDRWFDLSKTDKNHEGLLNLMLKDQFMQSWDKDLRLLLREKIPKTIEDVAVLANHFREDRGGNTNPLINRSKRHESTNKVMPDASSGTATPEVKTVC